MLTFNFIDWAARSFSFFNTIVLLWLGLTVLLNVERRVWGTWIVGGGLVFGGLFFVGHTAIVGTAMGILSEELTFWWYAVWLMFLTNPFAWYLAMAWYTGALSSRRHRIWLFVMSSVGIMAAAFLLFSHPLPSYRDLLDAAPAAFISLGGIPVVSLLYPVYSAACFVLTLFVLRQPGMSTRFMGDMARRRARPWLMAASLMLLGVSLIVGIAAVWVLQGIQAQQLRVLSPEMLTMLAGLDLLISGLLAVTIVLLGQAIVSYEVFTGKALPRGGLFRDWRNILILASGYGILVGASLSLSVDPVYRLLVATVLMAVFLAFLSWRSFIDREQGMARLRPFVISQRLYDQLLMPSATLEVDTNAPFRALCEDVVGARVAYLAALGPLASLVGPILSYPGSASLPVQALAGLADRFQSPETICVPVEPAQNGGAVWAVPLWSERGLIGVLLLGEKRDGRPYAQEEIEIARAAGERLIDIRASAEMARRLMSLQRQRLTESQVIDRSTRRTLHDEVLPQLHTALLSLSGSEFASSETTREVVAQLAGIHRTVATLMQAMPAATAPEVARLGLVGALRQAVDLDLGGAFDGVTWQIEPAAERAALAIPALTAEVVFFAAREAIRNSALHGRGHDAGRPLHLSLSLTASAGLRITVEDDGVGLASGTAAAAGSGHGLALHSTMMAVIGGTLTAEAGSQGSTRVTLELP